MTPERIPPYIGPTISGNELAVQRCRLAHALALIVIDAYLTDPLIAGMLAHWRDLPVRESIRFVVGLADTATLAVS